MLIEIHIPRPLTLLLGIVAVTGWALWWNSTNSGPIVTGQVLTETQTSSTALSGAMGGVSDDTTKDIVDAEEKIFFARKAHQVIEKKEELLRYQLRLLEEEQKALGTISEEKEQEFLLARTNLVRLLQDKQKAEDQIREALDQLWNARLQGSQISINATGAPVALEWPVEPIYGISAPFRDPAYEKHFGFAHDGLDIPALQGTPILAPADGIIEKAVDNGLGYSYIIIKHSGIATLYGHVSSIQVTEGQPVRKGDQIGLSGGRPGTNGAGTTTTGPHLHLEVIQNGERIDPLTVLPYHPQVEL